LLVEHCNTLRSELTKKFRDWCERFVDEKKTNLVLGLRNFLQNFLRNFLQTFYKSGPNFLRL